MSRMRGAGCKFKCEAMGSEALWLCEAKGALVTATKAHFMQRGPANFYDPEFRRISRIPRGPRLPLPKIPIASMHRPRIWTYEMDERLLHLFRAGHSQTDVALQLQREFGRRFTACIVAGRLRDIRRAWRREAV